MEPRLDDEGDRYVALARAVLKNKSFLSRFPMGNRELLSNDNVYGVYFQYNHIVSYANWVEDKHLVVDTSRPVDLVKGILYVKYPYPSIKFPMEFAHEIGEFGGDLVGYPTRLSERWTQGRLDVLISTLGVAINLVSKCDGEERIDGGLAAVLPKRCRPSPYPDQFRFEAEAGRGRS